MLKKRHRLTKKEFELVFSKGTRLPISVGQLKVLHEKTGRKASCTVSKKELKKSVDRTRVRRLGYAAVRENFSLLPADTWLVWFLPKKTSNMKVDALSDAFQQAIEQI